MRCAVRKMGRASLHTKVTNKLGVFVVSESTVEAPEEAVDGAVGDQQEPGSEALGEKGVKALQAEREARKAAEKQAREAAAALQQIQDEGKSEAEKQADRIAAVEAQLAAVEAEKRLLAMSNETGIPPSVLAGPTQEGLEAYAKVLQEWRDSAGTKRIDYPVGGVGSPPQMTGDAFLRGLAR